MAVIYLTISIRLVSHSAGLTTGALQRLHWLMVLLHCKKSFNVQAEKPEGGHLHPKKNTGSMQGFRAGCLLSMSRFNSEFNLCPVFQEANLGFQQVAPSILTPVIPVGSQWHSGSSCFTDGRIKSKCLIQVRECRGQGRAGSYIPWHPLDKRLGPRAVGILKPADP